MDKNKNNQSISEKADMLISQYHVNPNVDKEEVLGTVLNKIERKETKSVRQINWFRAAGISAAATVAVLLAFYFFTATIAISAGDSKILTYRMPDDSRIVLRSGSNAEFGKYFRKRQVALEGEAYFEVEKGDGFVVKTDNGIVRVLGTRFLVSGKNSRLNVKCYQGKVETEFENKSWILEPGTQFAGDESTANKSRFDESVQFPDFALFSKNFTSAPLTEVVQRIEDFFKVQINLQPGITKTFSGSIQTANLESALQIVCESLRLNYEFEDDYRIKIFNY
ncbi:FecR family protein [Tangfeifania diversioriginum]|uniref:FecR family protein n=1 Tax=Tangfeifania diversioriginum TaxID=1168035 RepID=A0A1M6EAS1_9BACT|nr:FecR family protein [Tangfeifania diversioriginum]SHI82523.1 FecR family protein [Tangfeifania diversioriginum]